MGRPLAGLARTQAHDSGFLSLDDRSRKGRLWKPARPPDRARGHRPLQRKQRCRTDMRIRIRCGSFHRPKGLVRSGRRPRTSNHELPRLFEHFRSEPVRTLCLVALKTGMRQGELFALRWADVTLKRRSFAFALAIRAAHLARQRTVSEGTSISFPTWSSSSHVCVTVARTKTSCFPARTVRDSSHRPLCSDVISTLQ